MTYFSNLSVCSLRLNQNHYKTPSSIRLKEVSYQEVGRLSTTTYDLQQRTALENQLRGHVLSLPLRFGTSIAP